MVSFVGEIMELTETQIKILLFACEDETILERIFGYPDEMDYVPAWATEDLSDLYEFLNENYLNEIHLKAK